LVDDSAVVVFKLAGILCPTMPLVCNDDDMCGKYVLKMVLLNANRLDNHSGADDNDDDIII